MFVFPTWFHGPPSMLRGWLERVWLPGVAFLPAERKGQLAKSGMRHIRRLTVVTTGGSPRWFVLMIGDPGRRLFTRARALFAWRCKVTWLQLRYERSGCTRPDHISSSGVAQAGQHLETSTQETTP